MKILCVHQGAELYGSDRSFLQAVEGFRTAWPDAHIRVLLAMDGPLVAQLAKHADVVDVRDLFVLRLANPVPTALKGTAGLPYYLSRALADIAAADIAYINTTVVADFMLAARLNRSKAIIHIREIPKPRAMPVIRSLVRFSGARDLQLARHLRGVRPATGFAAGSCSQRRRCRTGSSRA